MPGRPSQLPPAPPPVEPMSGAELRVAAERLYGTRGWQKGLGDALDLDVSTIRRYVDSGRVPLVVAAAVRHVERLQRAQAVADTGGATGEATGEGAGVPSAHRAPDAVDQASRRRSSVGR